MLELKKTAIALDEMSMNMKKHWFLGLIFLSMFLFCWCTSLAQEAKGPKIILKEREFDFKKVREGEVVSHAFAVRNKGDHVLKIVTLKPAQFNLAGKVTYTIVEVDRGNTKGLFQGMRIHFSAFSGLCETIMPERRIHE